MRHISYFVKSLKIKLYFMLFMLLVLNSCASDATNVGGSGEPKWSLVSAGGTASATQWTARSGHQVVLKDGSFYLFGGDDNNFISKNDVWSSSDGVRWTEVSAHEDNPTDKWTARSGHQVVLKDGSFYLFGGLGVDNNTIIYHNDVWSSSDGKTWTQVSAGGTASATQWLARYGHAVVLKDGAFYLFGGSSDIDNQKDTDQKNDVWSSSNGESWTRVSAGGTASATQWSARHAHEVVLKGGEVYLLGGDDGTQKNDVWSSSNGESWTQVSAHKDSPTDKWTGRTVHEVVLKDGAFYLFGGTEDKKIRNDVWRSSDGKTWTQVSAGGTASATQWSARHGHQVVLKDGAFYLFGGYDNTPLGGGTNKKNFKNDVWVFR